MVHYLVLDGRRSFLVPPGLPRPSSIPNPPRTKFFVCHTSAHSMKNARSEQAPQAEGLTLTTFIPSSYGWFAPAAGSAQTVPVSPLFATHPKNAPVSPFVAT